MSIEYKSPGDIEWQRIEVVVDAVHDRMWAISVGDRGRERKPRESEKPAEVPIGIAEILGSMFGVSVQAELPPVPVQRKNPSHASITPMVERFIRQGDEVRRLAVSRPGIRSAGSRVEKLVELGRLFRNRQPRRGVPPGR